MSTILTARGKIQMDSEIKFMEKKKIDLRLIVASAALLILLYFGADSLGTAVGIDWRETYYPAARARAFASR